MRQTTVGRLAFHLGENPTTMLSGIPDHLDFYPRETSLRLRLFVTKAQTTGTMLSKPGRGGLWLESIGNFQVT